jgi:hypothetical protein
LRWFGKTLDARILSGAVDWAHLLGTLALSDDACDHSDTRLLLPVDARGCMSAVSVQPEVIAAVSKAQNELLMQCRDFPGDNAAPLERALLQAANRGVKCRLLWDMTHTPSLPPADGYPTHANIENRTATLSQEILLADEEVAIGSSACPVHLPGGAGAMPVLLAARMDTPRVCGTVSVAFQEAWESAVPLGAATHPRPCAVGQPRPRRSGAPSRTASISALVSKEVGR